MSNDGPTIGQTLAAQSWCDPETAGRTMDPVLATAFAKRADGLVNTIELAWGLIANAYGGDWDSAPSVWKDAAIRWRDEYWHPLLKLNQSSDEPAETNAT